MKKLILLGVSMLILTGCGTKDTSSYITDGTYSTIYNGNVSLVEIASDEDDKVNYIETSSGDTKSYLDSFIITSKYNQGKGALVFAQESLSALDNQSISIENDKVSKHTIICGDKRQSAILLSYQIIKGLKTGIPPLYMTHLFVEKDASTITIFSHSTESKEEAKNTQNALLSIVCQKIVLHSNY
ncbi:hypothetical protein AGMMS50249_2180 [candidate division SR1 bacterium]|nr:hypothetical protein AGMMS50249_2180 [candidate division SR1 bacterium]